MTEIVAPTESQDVEGLKQDAPMIVKAEEPVASPAPSAGELRYKLLGDDLDPELFALKRAREGDAAFDLRACFEDGLMRGVGLMVPPMRAANVPSQVGTGIAVEIPEGFCGLVLPRSGMACRAGITLANSPGLIDSGYRGEIQLAIVNHGSQPAHLRHGDRVAQLLIVPAPLFAPVQVDELSDSERGEDGLGSTGIK